MNTLDIFAFRRTTASASAVIRAFFAALCITAPAGAAFAQQQGQLSPITVEATHQVQTKQVGLSYTGIPIEQVKLSRQVGYSDLKLGTPSGAAELEKRIRTTAQEACKQLQTLYPSDAWLADNRTCIDDAISHAMTQERSLVAAAQKSQ